MDNEYYVYMLSFEDSNKAYIGITSNVKDRLRNHKSCKSVNPHKDNWIKKNIGLGKELEVTILHGPLTREEACRLEILEIKSRDNLVNISLGGDVPSYESIEKSRKCRLKTRVLVDCVDNKVYVTDDYPKLASQLNINYKASLDSQYRNSYYLRRYRVFTEDDWNSMDDITKEFIISGQDLKKHLTEVLPSVFRSNAISHNKGFYLCVKGSNPIKFATFRDLARECGFWITGKTGKKVNSHNPIKSKFYVFTSDYWDSMEESKKQQYLAPSDSNDTSKPH